MQKLKRQLINLSLPIDMLKEIEKEAYKLGITRNAQITIMLDKVIKNDSVVQGLKELTNKRDNIQG